MALERRGGNGMGRTTHPSTATATTTTTTTSTLNYKHNTTKQNTTQNILRTSPTRTASHPLQQYNTQYHKN